MLTHDQFELAYRRLCDVNGNMCDEWDIECLFSKYEKNPERFANITKFLTEKWSSFNREDCEIDSDVVV